MLRHSSLVAGNVTGGGGKATTTKTYGHCALRKRNKNVQTFLDADRKVTLRRDFSGYKNRQIERVHVRFATPLENASAFSRGITNTLFLNLFINSVFVF
jgi:hypothetical protein